MKKSEIITLAANLAEQATAGTEIDLVDVEYVKESGRYFLRVYIDKPGGITVDDCHQVHVRLDELLDQADPIDHPYVLEVSSQGWTALEEACGFCQEHRQADQCQDVSTA